MALRTISYTVSNAELSPSSAQFGGMQNEHNATEVKYTIDSKFLASLQTEGHSLLYRIDFDSPGAGYQPSENLQLSEKNSVSRKIPRALTQYGGQMQSILVISSLDEESNEEFEVLSLPSAVHFAAVQKSDNNLASSLSAYLVHIEKLVNRPRELLLEIENRLHDDEFKGDKGDKGDPFTYQDFTEEQLERLKGEVSLSYMHQNVANGLKTLTSGETLTLTDASPLAHNVDVKVSPITDEISGRGLWHDTDKENKQKPLNIGGVLKCDIVSNEGVKKETPICIMTSDGRKHKVNTSEVVGVYARHIIHYNCVIEGETLTVSGYITNYSTGEKITDINQEFEVNKNSVITGVAVDVTDDDGYSPEVGNTFIVTRYITVYKVGKNLLNAPCVGDISEQDFEIRYIPDEDCILINGTAPSGADYCFNCNVPIKPNKTYYAKTTCISGSVTGTGTGTGSKFCALGVYDGSAQNSVKYCQVNFGNSVTNGFFDSGTDRLTVPSFWFYFTAGTVFENYKVRVQLSEGNNVEYERFAEPEIKTPSADGTLTVTSAYPTTHVYTNTSGVTIEAEYNRDINKAYAELINKTESALTTEGAVWEE